MIDLIKNTLLGGTDFNTPTDRIRPTDLNDTFNVIAPNLIKRVAFDDTPASTTGTTYATFATIAVAADSVIDHIMVQVTMIASASYIGSSGDGHNSQIDILIGETGSEVSKYQKTIGDRPAGASDIGGKYFTTITYYYEPTASEKTNGFNVIINGKTTDIGAGSANFCGYDKCDVFAG